MEDMSSDRLENFQGLHGDQMEKLLGYLGPLFQVDLT